jgi:hypothetical protein
MLLKTATKIPAKKKTAKEISLPPAHDWRTSDQDEINRRILRAREERPRIHNLTPDHPVFSNFDVHSASGMHYEVEIRDWAQRREALLAAILETGRALAIEARLPEPATPQAVLAPPLSHAWGNAREPLAAALGNSSAPWSEALALLENLSQASPSSRF